ncbi:hypothetical protein CONCODRAFT_7675 [Conidiobolus coronatus NRRL 28638]|uniref:Secreted protein n=1 Tax=Conidiobolus coronatus (strain ATCC 28846 / CBS 209.66 / NRRL 28638) TaxID=796925 RepID=A0A137P4I1_CONC2|nr:hypothetical protein CONCODRAFT_7675 [Conidiobolus coronatus NRRL 28638]|eukprot:KXN69849.1 hypothetical protein CONCODRAFT_7675 [Conidiobolus coronatus NRRL 28638]
MKLNHIISLFSLTSYLSGQDTCPDPFEVGYTTLTAYYKDSLLECANIDQYTHCQHNYYTTPDEGESVGGCKFRKEPEVMDVTLWNYDCKSINNQWKFGKLMVKKYNLTCEFKISD